METITIYQAIILGVVQGLTELLPVSSSAHLNLIPMIFNWSMPESFDVALHLGTLLAITLFFFKDWINLIKGGYKQVVKKEKSTEGKIFWYIVIATIPTGIISLILDKFSEYICEKFGIEMILIAIALIVMGIILYIVDKKSESKVKYEDITFKQSMLISLSQAIAAAFPGVSRSGITMTVARALKIDRESAAKYSFLLSTPIIAAAVVFSITDFEFTLAFFLGVLASFLVGIFVIKFLLEYLKKGSFKVFAIYRIVLGLIITAIFFARL
jgi:undecaprenyl-diphosphatase